MYSVNQKFVFYEESVNWDKCRDVESSHAGVEGWVGEDDQVEREEERHHDLGLHREQGNKLSQMICLPFLCP